MLLTISHRAMVVAAGTGSLAGKAASLSNLGGYYWAAR